MTCFADDYREPALEESFGEREDSIEVFPMPICIVCNTPFSPLMYWSQAEPCDCGSEFTREDLLHDDEGRYYQLLAAWKEVQADDEGVTEV